MDAAARSGGHDAHAKRDDGSRVGRGGRRDAGGGIGAKPRGAVHAGRQARARQQGRRGRAVGDHAERERLRDGQRLPERRRSARLHFLCATRGGECLPVLRRRRLHRLERRCARHPGRAGRDARPRAEGRRRRPLGDLAELRRRDGDRQHLPVRRRRARVRGLHADRRSERVRLLGRRQMPGNAVRRAVHADRDRDACRTRSSRCPIRAPRPTR